MTYIESIYKNISGNKETIRRSNKCGCICCKKTFSSSQVTKWSIEPNGGETAECPFCGIDMVVGDSGFSSRKAFAQAITDPYKPLVVVKHTKVEAEPPAYSGDLFIARYEGGAFFLLKVLTAKQVITQKVPNDAYLFPTEDDHFHFFVGFEYETLEDASAAAKEEYHINEDKWVHDDDPNRLLNVSHDECE